MLTCGFATVNNNFLIKKEMIGMSKRGFPWILIVKLLSLQNQSKSYGRLSYRSFNIY
jgi:hypothetical protein